MTLYGRAQSSSSGERTDEELVRALAGGSHEALGPLYARYAALVFGIAAKSLDEAAAEEIVQDVFLAVWRGAAGFDEARGPVRPWLLQIAHHRVINELRKRSRRPRSEPDPGGLRLVTLPDPEPDPADAAGLEADREAVRAALASLPPPQQEAVGLAFFGDMTHEQVATALNVPLGTVKTRIRSGLQKLRVRLAPIVAVVLVGLGGVLALLGVRFHTAQEERRRDERALRLVTSSDVTAVRMEAAPGVAAETHGQYRGRAGDGIAIVTLSNFAPAPKSQAYQVWARVGGVWVSLGVPHLDGAGHAMLIVEDARLVTLPDTVEVTLEPSGGSSQPSGLVVVSWQAAR